MICFRVVRRKYDDLSGYGAKLFGGRFNPPGIPAVYTSESIALAVLEVLVHLDKSEMPEDYIVMAIRFSGQNVFRPRTRQMSLAGHLTPAQFKSAFYDRPVLRVPCCFPEADEYVATVEWTEALDFDKRLMVNSDG